MSELNIEIKTEIYKRVGTLNLETFVLFCKIARYKDKLTESMYKFMSEGLQKLYINEFSHVTGEYLIKRKREIYEREAREEVFAPKIGKFFHRRNKMAKLIDKGVAYSAAKLFEACEDIFVDFRENVSAKILELVEELALPSGVNDQSEVSEPSNGVKERGEQAAPSNVVKHALETLPITTLQACDELISYARKNEPSTPQKCVTDTAKK